MIVEAVTQNSYLRASLSFRKICLVTSSPNTVSFRGSLMGKKYFHLKELYEKEICGNGSTNLAVTLYVNIVFKNLAPWLFWRIPNQHDAI